MQKYNIIIIHGTDGSPDGNWFLSIKQRLESAGHCVYIPKFPTPKNQSVESWSIALEQQTPKLAENIILIGHSCGATFLLHILENMEKPVAKSIFVSGFIDKLDNEFFDSLNKTFVEHDFDWDKIRKNAGEITVFHGDNDPYVPVTKAQRLSDNLKVPLTIIENGGHLNSEFGYTDFPEILYIIK